MKITDLILKIAAVVFALAAVACLVVANLEKISVCAEGLCAKLKDCKPCCCRCQSADEEDLDDDEFEDWDI